MSCITVIDQHVSISKHTSSSSSSSSPYTLDVSQLPYHLKTLWLFTHSDIKSIVLPTLAFGILSTFSSPVLAVNNPDLSQFTTRILTLFAWAWLNLLLLCLNNQRNPEAIAEDKINKPWRPLPSNRISSSDATTLLLAMIPITAVINISYTGCLWQSILLAGLNLWYNDYEGGENPLFRNVINACGFTLYNSAALEILVGQSCAPLPFATAALKSTEVQWLAMIWGLVFTTIQIQDLRDQEGDRIRNRPTLPLLVGDVQTRISLIVAIAFWSTATAVFWRVPLAGVFVLAGLSGHLIRRLWSKRSADDDRKNFKLWSLWLMGVYAMPLVKRYL
ncbi:MAG: hypothetical protein Q9222_002025 [Ikaeria aurantiellina]